MLFNGMAKIRSYLKAAHWRYFPIRAIKVKEQQQHFEHIGS